MEEVDQPREPNNLELKGVLKQLPPLLQQNLKELTTFVYHMLSQENQVKISLLFAIQGQKNCSAPIPQFHSFSRNLLILTPQ